MIRPATADDIAAVVVLGAVFHAESGWAEVCEYVPDDEARTCAHLVDSADGFLIVAEVEGEIVGAIAGLAFPAHMNLSHRLGNELFWFVLPEHRQGVGTALRVAAEQAARDMGCAHFGMMCLESLRPEAVGRALRRDGYRPTERCFMKRL